jgi:hypothetical protein
VRRLLVGLAIAVFAAPAVAGDLTFTASVDQTTVGIGQQFQLVLTVQGEGMLNAPSPELPAVPDLNVLGRSSSQSTSLSIMNGQMQQQATISFIYVLSAKRLGKTVIPPCTLDYQGKQYRTQSIELTVVQAPQGQATPVPGGGGMPGGPGAPAAPAQIPMDGNLFLSVVPSRRTVYVGEPVAVEITLCSRFQIDNGGWAQMPAFDGFWTEKVYDADRFDFQRRTIDGRTFIVSVLKKVMLFPLAAGDATIQPMAFNVTVVQPPRDFMDLFGRSQNVQVKSKPLTIKVLPLPDAGKPKEFTGGVGRFTLDASLDRASSTNGEPVNVIVKLAGTGNLHEIDAPAVPAISGVRVLAPEVKDDSHVAGDQVTGSKTFRFPILPQSDGKFAVAPIVLAYFDPAAKAYRTLTTRPLEFTASGSATASAPLTEASGLKVLGTDIDYIKPDASSLSPVPLSPPAWPNMLYVLGLGLVVAAMTYRGHNERLVSDRAYARKSRSSSLVRRRLRTAEQRMKKKDDRGFHEELSRALIGYIGDRFNIDTHALTRDQLRAELARHEVAPETVTSVLDIVNQCEVARFSPGLATNQGPESLFETVRTVMGRL